MLTADFDYTLPPELIAQHPAPRGSSRLLCLDEPDTARHRSIAELAKILRPDDLLVLNDTRVIPARLHGRLGDGGRVEILLVERDERVESGREWTCLAKPGRRTRPGATIRFGDGLEAEVLDKLEAGLHRMRFFEPVEPHLEALGEAPLPPYIKRPDGASAEDRERYQTVWARSPGAIAAPTAGLHFDQVLLDSLVERGIEIVTLTLHVGIGTFKPVTTTLVHEHRMERERYKIGAPTAAAIEEARHAGRRIVAVGTTVVRTLEAAALRGDNAVAAGHSVTELFITPGFHFQVVDVLLTNFHLPRSTLLMLVSAFCGRERVLTAYVEAIAEGYGFYSYGDAMLTEKR